MQYQNYLPYATSMESPPPGLTPAFSFSLKEEEKKKRPRKRGWGGHGGETNQTQILIPRNILVPKETKHKEWPQCQDRCPHPTPRVPSAPLCCPGPGQGRPSLGTHNPSGMMTLVPSGERGGWGSEAGRGEKAFYKGQRF